MSKHACMGLENLMHPRKEGLELLGAAYSGMSDVIKEYAV